MSTREVTETTATPSKLRAPLRLSLLPSTGLASLRGACCCAARCERSVGAARRSVVGRRRLGRLSSAALTAAQLAMAWRVKTPRQPRTKKDEAKSGRKARSALSDVVTREYTIILHKRVHDTGFKHVRRPGCAETAALTSTQRAPRAVKELTKFAQKHMGTPLVRIDPSANEAIWARGIKSVPHRLRVRLSRASRCFLANVLAAPAVATTRQRWP